MSVIRPDGERLATDELQIEYWPIERLIPSERNARTHSNAQIAEIAGSIRAFGFTNPLLVGEGADVVAGHGLLAAARLLGLSEVPVIPLRSLNEVERRQRMLADNRIALKYSLCPAVAWSFKYRHHRDGSNRECSQDSRGRMAPMFFPSPVERGRPGKAPADRSQK
jgi:hypothetical protein